MDEFLFKSATKQGESKPLVFSHKQWIPVIDTNGKSYTSRRINWDLSNVANTGRDFYNPSETYIQIPMMLDVEFKSNTVGTSLLNDNSTASVKNQLMASLKNGSYNVLNSINYKINGNEVIMVDKFENLKINYDILTSWSHDTLKKRGQDLYFTLDDESSYTIDTKYGAKNNEIDGGIFDIDQGFKSLPNFGRRERMRRTNNYDSSDWNLCTDNAKMKYYNNDVCEISAHNNSTGVQYVTYYIMVSFKLGDIHPLFKQLPLTKNISQYLSIEVNTDTELNFTVAGGAISALSITNETNTLPFQISNVGDGLDLRAAAAGSIKMCLSVLTSKYSNKTHNLGGCYIQACFVQMNEDYEKSYLSNPVRNLIYNECYCQYGTGMTDIQPSSQVNQLISGTFRKLRKLVIIPMLSKKRPDGTNDFELYPEKSPFASEPSTTSFSLGSVDNFNIRIGTQNVYQTNIKYDWEQFQNEFQNDSAINGGLQSEINNGLIDRAKWDKCYGYRVVDLSKIPFDNDLIEKQITVQFTNNSKLYMNYYVLVYYEKSLGLDITTGNLTIV